VYFGTYTGGKDGSKGIYRAKFDPKTGKLSPADLAAEVGSPSFLAVRPDGKALYAVGETGGKDGGGVYSYALDPKTGALTKTGEGTSGGSGPCHIAALPGGNLVGVANYGGGSTGFLAVDAAGAVGKRVAFFQHAGSGPDAGRQKEPHAHCTQFDPTGKYAVTVDLGVDKVKVYALTSTGVVAQPDRDIVLPPGSGPRHIAIAPDGKFAYVCGELDSTVNVVRLDLSGKSETVQSLSTLPHPVKGNSTAECVLHPSGKFVYVSNRGHNSVAVFKVNDDRKVTAAGHITGDIKTPRNFNVDPTGKWMLIASQDGGKVGVWELDPATGLGKETGTTIAVDKPVCVKFAPAE
ncbi:MAG TPA: lactonase family protein, partial [Urbifossiella sp.]|jgi:6-phosphogluconolactonase|nr:lactonase family protein [Urbifossiella sp.]